MTWLRKLLPRSATVDVPRVVIARALRGFADGFVSVFLAIYLYSWDSFSPRKHLLVGLPLPIAGTLATLCVVAVFSRKRDAFGSFGRSETMM